MRHVTVTPLPSVTSQSEFSVQWTGEDDAGGSGVRDYTIYVSTNDGPYEVWLANTTETQATFGGENNTTYAFYSTARDNVYHVEDAPLIPDATTFVQTNQPPEASAGGPYSIVEGDSLTLDASASSDPDDDPLTFTWDINGDGLFGDATGETATLTWQQLGDLGISDNGSWTVTVLADDGNGGTDDASTTLSVTNAAPTIDLTGASTVDEGTLYTLTLGSVTDPGNDMVSDYIIHWGDGQQDTIAAADLPASGEVTHTYADDDSLPTILVDLIDEDGTHPNAGLLEITVNNVAPTLALSGDASVDEGSSYTLSIGPVTDPGDDTVTEYIVHWGDGQQDTIAAADLPANREVAHTYADGNASPTILVDLIDEDGTHVDARSLTITVDDVPPRIDLQGDNYVDEGALYTLTLGAVIDPGDDTVTEYNVHWGDGSTNTYTSSGDVSHTYADDSTPQIIVDLKDEDGTHAAAGTLTIAVDNVPPTIELHGAGYVDEGSPYTLTLGEITDPGDDTVTEYLVHWGDGSSSSYNAGGDVTHTYTDGLTTPIITVDLTDEDGTHTDAGSFSLEVGNVPPRIELHGVSYVDEGSPYTLTLGEIIDPGDDTVTEYIVHWGDGSTNHYDSEGEVTHTYADGFSTPTITADVTDEDGTHTGAGSLALQVGNVPPTITAWTNTALDVGNTVVDESVHVSADFLDPGFDNPVSVEDFVTSTIDWGDGTVDTAPAITVAETPGSVGVLTTGTVSGTHRYATGGVYDITITIRDDDGGTATMSTQAYVTGVGVNNGVLQVVGTSDKDKVHIKPKHGDIEVDTDFDEPKKQSFGPKGITSILVALGSGDDHVHIDKNILLETTIDGGPGKDHLHAGGGSTTMFGGPGDDKLYGGDAADILYGGPGDDDLKGKKGDDRLFGEDGDDDLKGEDGDDILVGGDGRDKLKGGKGDDLVIGGRDADDLKGDKGSDILIAGLTIYDHALWALDAVFAKWLSKPDYDARVDAVTTDTGSIWDDPFLAPGVTVFDDQSSDKGKGGSGRDLFFADIDDQDGDDDLLKDLKMKKDEELVIELAELLAI